MYPGAVHRSAASGKLPTLLALAKLGADVNDADEKGRTPMLLAAQSGRDESVRMLVELGADINRADKDGRTPVWMAAENGHEEAYRALVELGANANSADESRLASQSAIRMRSGRSGVRAALDAKSAAEAESSAPLESAEREREKEAPLHKVVHSGAGSRAGAFCVIS
jgi:ankyrin repeat protein